MMIFFCFLSFGFASIVDDCVPRVDALQGLPYYSSYCKDRCAYYATDGKPWCPGASSGADLAGCVGRLVSNVCRDVGAQEPVQPSVIPTTVRVTQPPVIPTTVRVTQPPVIPSTQPTVSPAGNQVESCERRVYAPSHPWYDDFCFNQCRLLESFCADKGDLAQCVAQIWSVCEVFGGNLRPTRTPDTTHTTAPAIHTTAASTPKTAASTPKTAASTPWPSHAPASGEPKMFHYFPAWGVWTRDYPAYWLPGSKATGALYAFFDVTADCECKSTDKDADFKKGASWGGIADQVHGPGATASYQSGTWDYRGCAGNRAHMHAVVEQNPGYEVLMSLGGWTLSSNFHKCFKHPENRKKLIDSVVFTAGQYGFFTGIDVDWEYPGKYTEDGVERPLTDSHVEVGYWLEFVREMKVRLPQLYHTSAIGMSPELLNKEFQSESFCHVLEDLKYVFTMSYDFHGAWSNTTGHNAPLYDNPASPVANQGFNVHDSLNVLINNWNNKCRHLYDHDLEPKIVLGLAAYGRSWTEVQGDGTFVQAAGAGPGSIVDPKEGWGSLDFWDIKTNYLNKPGVQRMWDDVSKVPYLVGQRQDGICCLAKDNGAVSKLCEAADCKFPGRFYITYDDEQSIRLKAEFARQRGLGGLMFWEASGDREWDLLNAAYEGWGSAVRVPRVYTSVTSVPSFCGPEDAPIEGYEPGTGCYVQQSWYFQGGNNACSALANFVNDANVFIHTEHKDPSSCCQYASGRTAGFGTKDQVRAALRAGQPGDALCAASVIQGSGAGCHV
ncbi:MAG: hypothetical protein KVP17_001257 [Porospora cf. gigantea B]|uniref:uncharacterized protein n=1 Tax=Porospora cf. gigantea B TaxID=2853592 RepID=UPI00357199F4|nr:MAG: hypothetical protein KVP17_001257 [Porospora cf. gigantea B]